MENPKPMREIVSVYADTGEICGELSGKLISYEESSRRKEHFKKEYEKNEIEKYKLKTENRILRGKLGIEEDKPLDKIPSKFIWAYFQEQQRMFPDLKTQDISRLVYLSTYVEHKTNILKNKKIPIKPTEIFKLMNLDYKTYRAWIKKMIDHRYIEFKKDLVYINNNFIYKGSLGKILKDNEENIRAVRLFTDMIQELYLNLSPTEHHKMGVVLQMIPYINPYFNCLAKNPHCAVRENLIPMTLGELAEKLGYSVKQCKRLGNDILSTRFGVDGKRIAVMVALDNMNPEDMIILFNAKLFFRGNALEYNEVNKIFESFSSDVVFELPS